MSVQKHKPIGNGTMDSFLRELNALPGVAEGTYLARNNDLKIFNEWLEETGRPTDPLELDRDDLKAYFLHLAEQGYAPNTIGTKYESVRVLYNHLEDEGEIDEDDHPFESLDKSKFANGKSMKHDGDEITYLIQEQKESLAENVGKPRLRNELLIRLLWQTGMRASEVVRIELGKLDQENRTIRIYAPKTDSWRTVKYHPNLDLLLDRWLNGGYREGYAMAHKSDYLFPGQSNEHLYEKQPNMIVREAADNAGIQKDAYTGVDGRQMNRITAHTLRHGHAIHAIDQGIDIKRLKEHLGHQDISTTERYLQFIDQDVTDAFETQFSP